VWVLVWAVWVWISVNAAAPPLTMLFGAVYRKAWEMHGRRRNRIAWLNAKMPAPRRVKLAEKGDDKCEKERLDVAGDDPESVGLMLEFLETFDCSHDAAV